MMELQQVSHRFGDRQVLDRVDLTLREDRIAVLGANGSGKSTFARLLNGLLLPSEGEVRVDGLTTRCDGKAVRRLVGFVFQNPDAQIVLPTVVEDVALGLRDRGLSRAEIDARVDAALVEYGLADHRDHPAHLLSGGQKQLLAICSALIVEPRYVVMDEPTTLLDHRNARAVTERIASLDQQVVVITHDLDLARTCERVLVLDEGRIVADDVPRRAIDAYLETVG
jgi:biotin transport system ATP-binding protein